MLRVLFTVLMLAIAFIAAVPQSEAACGGSASGVSRRANGGPINALLARHPLHRIFHRR